MKKNNKNMRTAFIRVSAENHTHTNEIVEYTIEDIIKILDDWNKTKSFKYYVCEHDEDPDNIHFHMVLEFPKSSEATFMTVKGKFPYGDIQTCKYSVRTCVRYLVHADDVDKFQYDWSEIITNAPDKLEYYKENSKSNHQKQLDDILEKIADGRIREYEKDKIPYNIYINHKNKIKNAFEYRQLLIAQKPDRDLQVIVLFGPSRVGKSLYTRIYAEENNKSISRSSASNDPWQDYLGQDIFVYDDFNFESAKIEDMLKALDPHNTTSVSARYKNRLFVGDTIFICTNINIENWYPNADREHRKALYSRISCILHFIDNVNGVAHFTINNMVDTVTDSYIIDSNDPVEPTFTRWALTQTDDRVREIDFNKYIDVDKDRQRTEKFINSLDNL